MSRILIVEDDLPTLRELQDLFSEEFTGCKPDITETVAEGLQLIEAAAERGLPYHVAVLDFKLPQDKGENPEIDESLCLKIRDKMPETYIAHITMYPDDPLVQKHLSK